eukprot:2758213-Amphidinium_carterae.2
MGDEAKKQYVTVTVPQQVTRLGNNYNHEELRYMQQQLCSRAYTSHTIFTWTAASTSSLQVEVQSFIAHDSACGRAVGEVDEVSQQADIPRQLRQPPQPAKKKQEEH